MSTKNDAKTTDMTTNPQSDAAPLTASHSGATGHPSIAAPLDLNGIRKRCDAATPGPWTDEGVCVVDVLDYNDGVYTDEQVARNYAFVKHAREDVPALLAALAASEARADALVDKLPRAAWNRHSQLESREGAVYAQYEEVDGLYAVCTPESLDNDESARFFKTEAEARVWGESEAAQQHGVIVESEAANGD